MDLAGTTVLITGAAGNLGRAVAARFHREGANCALLDREPALAAAFGTADARRLALATDLLDPDLVERAAAAATARFGRIDALCALAGGFAMGPAVHETGAEGFRALMDLNAVTLLHAVRAVVPRMLAAGGGRIVTVAAAAGLSGRAQCGAYTAAKAAVIRLTESMAAELGGRGIRVNCVLPSILDTPENRAAMPDADRAGWVSPAALADTIAFLCAGAARAVHGAAIPVTGAA